MPGSDPGHSCFPNKTALKFAAMRRYFPALAILLSLFSSTAPISAQTDLPQLFDHYRHKIFLLRGFYSGDRLLYDSIGTIQHADAGSWTTDGFVEVNDLSVSDHRLIIEARRVLISTGNRLGFNAVEEGKKRDKKAPKLKIEVDLGTDEAKEEKVASVLSKIFLTTQDSFADLVPDYWKPCIVDGLNNNNKNCGFSAELNVVPGMALAESAKAAPPTNIPDRRNMTFPQVGHGVTPPKVVNMIDPAFSDVARKARYHGVSTLLVVIDKTGHPTNIRISKPLGLGLDEKAVQSLERWKFEPSTKDGEPVAVQIAVELDFRLY